MLAQTEQEFEVIVVDDGSTDGGAAIVEHFADPRIRLITQENRGASAARNRGIRESWADLVAFLDADDEWYPAFLETALDLRRRYPGAGLYATPAIYNRTAGRLPRCGRASDPLERAAPELLSVSCPRRTADQFLLGGDTKRGP